MGEGPNFKCDTSPHILTPQKNICQRDFLFGITGKGGV